MNRRAEANMAANRALGVVPDQLKRQLLLWRVTHLGPAKK